jgi:hypothetical protein
LFRKNRVGDVAGVLGGLFVDADPGSVPFGAAAPAVDAGADAPAVFVVLGVFDDPGAAAGIVGVWMAGLVVVVFDAVPPAVLGVLAAVGRDAAAPAVVVESLGQRESPLQLMAANAARNAIPISQRRVAMLTS